MTTRSNIHIFFKVGGKERLRPWITISPKGQRILSIENTDTKNSVSKLQWVQKPTLKQRTLFMNYFDFKLHPEHDVHSFDFDPHPLHPLDLLIDEGVAFRYKESFFSTITISLKLLDKFSL